MHVIFQCVCVDLSAGIFIHFCSNKVSVYVYVCIYLCVCVYVYFYLHATYPGLPDVMLSVFKRVLVSVLKLNFSELYMLQPEFYVSVLGQKARTFLSLFVCLFLFRRLPRFRSHIYIYAMIESVQCRLKAIISAFMIGSGVDRKFYFPWFTLCQLGDYIFVRIGIVKICDNKTWSSSSWLWLWLNINTLSLSLSLSFTGIISFVVIVVVVVVVVVVVEKKSSKMHFESIATEHIIQGY